MELTISCTILDQFEVMKLARREVEAIKPRSEWDMYYPKSPSEALTQLARTSIANRVLPMEAVHLHKIGERVKDLDIPLCAED